MDMCARRCLKHNGYGSLRRPYTVGSQATLAVVFRQSFIKRGIPLEVVRSSKIHFTSLIFTEKLDILIFLNLYFDKYFLIN